MTKQLRAPFPYFGGRSAVASLIWDGLGNVSHYIEPFAGSLAVLLARPHKVGPKGQRLTETVNDADGLLVNFWRSMALKPDETIAASEWPVLELDLHARHKWLIGERESITEKLRADPEWCDPRAAGWWVWGASAWIGSGWGRVESRAMPSIGNGARGIHAFSGPARIRECAARMRHVRALCGDWRRVVGTSAVDKWIQGSVGVFLDPPYGEGAVSYAAGGNDSHAIVDDVWAWAESMQEHAHVRVAIAGYEGHPCLPGWHEVAWDSNKHSKGTGRRRDAALANCKRERLWFSPSCDLRDLPLSDGTPRRPRQPSLFEDVA